MEELLIVEFVALVEVFLVVVLCNSSEVDVLNFDQFGLISLFVHYL